MLHSPLFARVPINTCVVGPVQHRVWSATPWHAFRRLLFCEAEGNDCQVTGIPHWIHTTTNENSMSTTGTFRKDVAPFPLPSCYYVTRRF